LLAAFARESDNHDDGGRLLEDDWQDEWQTVVEGGGAFESPPSGAAAETRGPPVRLDEPTAARRASPNHR